MPRQLTAEDAKQSLNDHAAAKGADLWNKYGPTIGWPQLQEILKDRVFARYPCEIVFGAEGLQDAEFAHPVPKGDRPEEGFTIFVHPHFAGQLDHVPYLVLYQLVLVNYGEFASPEDAESFGAAALNLSRDDYYATVCAMADEVGASGVNTNPHCGSPDCGCGSGCA